MRKTRVREVLVKTSWEQDKLSGALNKRVEEFDDPAMIKAHHERLREEAPHARPHTAPPARMQAPV